MNFEKGVCSVLENEEKISVIVPVYNTKRYIYDCVKSVLKQTFENFELILIDDGSQDSSKDICEKLCRIDRRIQLIYQKHSGVSAARNAGIDAAKGKYLFFLDSDDIIHPQLLEALYKLQEKNNTIIATVELYYARQEKFRKCSSWKIERNYLKKGYYLDNNRAREPLLFKHSKTRLDTIGGKMILREAIGTIRFDEDFSHGEDTQFIYQLLSNGADVSVLLRKWYFYRRTEESSSMIYSVESCKSRYKVQKNICESAIKNGRVSEAVYTEWILLCEIVKWYEMGRKKKNIELEEYVKSIITTEKKTELFSKVDWCRRKIFYLGYMYYPLYKVIANIAHWYHENLDIPHEFQNKKS